MIFSMKAESTEDTVVDISESKKKYKEIQTTQWSNLPQDLANLIIKKLYITDQICFCAVCKDWRIPIGSRPVNELPWVMTHNLFNYYSGSVLEKKRKVMLLDPIHKKTHTILKFAGIESKYSNLFDGARICASKGSWLLLGTRKRYNEIALFLYSPFTNNVITLPTLSSITPYYGEATFSSTNPTSPDCIFVVTHCCEQYRMGISTYRNGDNKWKTKILDEDFGRTVKSLVCTEKGICYIVLRHRQLGSFCLESQEWSWLGEIPTFCDNMHLVEFNGDLLLVNCHFYYDGCKLYRYDENERGWIGQTSLGDRALFVGNCGSFLKPAIGDTAELADKILCNCHHNDVSGIRFYSLKDGKQYKEVPPYDWMVKDSLRKIWIEPPY